MTNASNPAVTWSLSPALGSIDANGVYTAPPSLISQQIVTLTATSAADPTQTASATITLVPDASITLTPSWATLYASETQQFTATTSNAGTSGVVWSISPANLGSITSDGLYTAPTSIASLQGVTITATSVANPAIAGSTTIWLSPQPYFIPPISVLPVAQGQTAAVNIDELATDGFPHPVVFSASGLPNGVTASFTPPTMTGTGSTALTVTAAQATAPGVYSVTITGTDTVYAGLTQSRTMQLVISGSQFILTATNADVVGTPGTSASVTLTEAASFGFADPVRLTVSGLPDGVTANFAPATLVGSGSTTLTLSIGNSAAAGVYVLVVTGTGTNSSASQSQPLTLVVQSPGLPQQALLNGWGNQDIGATAIPGSSGYTAGVFTVTGSGAGDGGTADQFQYAFTPLTGDGVVLARLANRPATGQAGIMIRNDTSPGASYVYISLGSMLMLDHRSSTGGESVTDFGTLLAMQAGGATLVNLVPRDKSSDGTRLPRIVAPGVAGA